MNLSWWYNVLFGVNWLGWMWHSLSVCLRQLSCSLSHDIMCTRRCITDYLTDRVRVCAVRLGVARVHTHPTSTYLTSWTRQTTKVRDLFPHTRLDSRDRWARANSTSFSFIASIANSYQEPLFRSIHFSCTTIHSQNIVLLVRSCNFK